MSLTGGLPGGLARIIDEEKISSAFFQKIPPASLLPEPTMRHTIPED